jgi:hypothetical protein
LYNRIRGKSRHNKKFNTFHICKILRCRNFDDAMSDLKLLAEDVAGKILLTKVSTYLDGASFASKLLKA